MNNTFSVTTIISYPQTIFFNMLISNESEIMLHYFKNIFIWTFCRKWKVYDIMQKIKQNDKQCSQIFTNDKWIKWKKKWSFNK